MNASAISSADIVILLRWIIILQSLLLNMIDGQEYLLKNSRWRTNIIVLHMDNDMK